MPFFEAEMTDGRVFAFEADERPTEDEVIQAYDQHLKDLKTTAWGAAGRSAIESMPSATAFSLGASAAHPLAQMIPQAGLPSTVAKVAIPLIGGVVAAGAAATGTESALKAVLPPEKYYRWKNLRESDMEYHKVASLAGSLAGGLPSMAPYRFFGQASKLAAQRTGKSLLAYEAQQLGKRAAIGAGIGTVLPMVSTSPRLPTWEDIVTTAGYGALYAGPRKWAALGTGYQRFVPSKPISETHYASEKQKAAAVHGDVSAQPGEGAGEVSAEVGGEGLQQAAQGIRAKAPSPELTEKRNAILQEIEQLESAPETQAKDAEGRPQIPSWKNRQRITQLKAQLASMDRDLPEVVTRNMSEEMVEGLVSERAAIDEPIPIKFMGEPGPGDPFSKRRQQGSFMVAASDAIYVDPINFRLWWDGDLAHLTLGQKRTALRQRLVHELIHSKIINRARPQDVQRYWNLLSKFEKAIETRRYFGDMPADTSRGASLRMGHEAIRFRFEQASQMTPSEFLETALAERWTLKSLTALENIVRGIRETFTTRGRQQRRIFDRVTRNIDFAKRAVQAGAIPSEIKERPGEGTSLSGETRFQAEGPASGLRKEPGPDPIERMRHFWSKPYKQAREAMVDHWNKLYEIQARTTDRLVEEGTLSKDVGKYLKNSFGRFMLANEQTIARDIARDHPEVRRLGDLLAANFGIRPHDVDIWLSEAKPIADAWELANQKIEQVYAHEGYPAEPGPGLGPASPRRRGPEAFEAAREEWQKKQWAAYRPALDLMTEIINVHEKQMGEMVADGKMSQRFADKMNARFEEFVTTREQEILKHVYSNDRAALDRLKKSFSVLGVPMSETTRWIDKLRPIAEEASRAGMALEAAWATEGWPENLGPGLGPASPRRRPPSPMGELPEYERLIEHENRLWRMLGYGSGRPSQEQRMAMFDEIGPKSMIYYLRQGQDVLVERILNSQGKDTPELRNAIIRWVQEYDRLERDFVSTWQLDLLRKGQYAAEEGWPRVGPGLGPASTRRSRALEKLDKHEIKLWDMISPEIKTHESELEQLSLDVGGGEPMRDLLEPPNGSIEKLVSAIIRATGRKDLKAQIKEWANEWVGLLKEYDREVDRDQIERGVYYRDEGYPKIGPGLGPSSIRRNVQIGPYESDVYTYRQKATRFNRAELLAELTEKQRRIFDSTQELYNTLMGMRVEPGKDAEKRQYARMRAYDKLAFANEFDSELMAKLLKLIDVYPEENAQILSRTYEEVYDYYSTRAPEDLWEYAELVVVRPPYKLTSKRDEIKALEAKLDKEHPGWRDRTDVESFFKLKTDKDREEFKLIDDWIQLQYADESLNWPYEHYEDLNNVIVDTHGQMERLTHAIDFTKRIGWPTEKLEAFLKKQETGKMTKVWFMTELQSDIYSWLRENPRAAKDFRKDDLKLIDDYARIGLKAAIEHAKKEGASAIVITDAKTSKMTQGHIGREYDAGHKAAYDDMLPNIARQLTGDQGTKIAFNRHWKTMEGEFGYEAPRGSVVETLFEIEEAYRAQAASQAEFPDSFLEFTRKTPEEIWALDNDKFEMLKNEWFNTAHREFMNRTDPNQMQLFEQVPSLVPPRPLPEGTAFGQGSAASGLLFDISGTLPEFTLRGRDKVKVVPPAPRAEEGPASPRRRRERYPISQQEMFMPGRLGRGQPGQEVVPISERGAPYEMPAGPTAMEIDKAARDYIEQTIATKKISTRKLKKRKPGEEVRPLEPRYEKPTLKGFVQKLGEWAGKVSPQQVYDVWFDNLYRHLQTTSDARINEWLTAYNLRRFLVRGTREGAFTELPPMRTEFPVKISSGRKAMADRMRNEAQQLEAMAEKTPTQAELQAQRAARPVPEEMTQAGLPGFAPPAAPKPVERPVIETKERLIERAKALRSRADLVEQGVRIRPSKGARGRTAEETGAMVYEQRRLRAIQQIVDASRREAETAPKRLQREKVEIDDIDFDNENAHEDPWLDISSVDSMEVLGRIFTDQARRRNTDPVTWTRNLAVLEHRRTGEVAIVSAYPFGLPRVGKLRAGASPGDRIRMVEPGMTRVTDRPNRPMADILRVWRPRYRILLKEPVQNFWQRFADMKTFSEELGNEGNQRAKESMYREFVGEAGWEGGRKVPKTPSELEAQEAAIERGEEVERGEAPEGLRPEDLALEWGELPPTGVVEGEGAWIRGPGEKLARVLMGLGRGGLRERSMATYPIVGSEASHLYQLLARSASRVDPAFAIGEVMNRLNIRYERGRRYPEDRMAMAALKKVAVEIQRRARGQLEPATVYYRTLDEISRVFRQAKDEGDFVVKMQSELGKPQRLAGKPEPLLPGEPGRVVAGAEPRAEPGGREISMLRAVPPTVTRPEQVPEGMWPRPGAPRPEPIVTQPRAIRQPEMLPAQMRRQMARRIPKVLPSRYDVSRNIWRYMRGIAKPTGRPPGPPIIPKVLSGQAVGRGIPKVPKPVGGVTGIEEGWMPASARRRIGALEMEMTRMRYSATAWVKRKAVEREMVEARDTTDNLANNIGRKVSNWIRTKITDPAMRAAANALVQAGAWRPRYKLNAEAQEAYDKMLAENRDYATAKSMMDTADISTAEQGRAWANDIEANVLRKLREAGLVTSTGVDWVFDENARQALNAYTAYLEVGEKRAMERMASENPLERTKGEVQMQAIEMLRPELEYAKANWDNPALREAALIARKEFEAQYDREVEAGYSLKYDDDYLPGRYEGEVFDDFRVRFFGGADYLGGRFREPGTFHSYYEAASRGPYKPKTRDIAAMLEHRVRQGMRMINKKTVFYDTIKTLVDPATNTPVAVDAKKPKGSDRYMPPSADYELWFGLGGKNRPLAVRKTYMRIINLLNDPSKLHEENITREALEAGQKLKHILLFMDIFHAARMSYLGLALKNSPRYGGGLAILEFRPGDLAEAHRAKLVDDKSYEWATAEVPVTINGEKVQMSRSHIGNMFETQTGLNIGRISDALYMELVKNIPFIRGFNRWVFDRLQRGIMMQSAIQEFERLNAKHPNVEAVKLAKDIARDLNVYYGSLGRQGLFRSATFQDIVRLPMLAPNWVEALLRKEVTGWARMTGISKLMGRGEGGMPYMGSTGRGMARGLAMMIALTQALNIITRHKPTWENEEEGHKWDAWIPSLIEEGEGFWLSPLSVFQELTHDVYRLIETKAKVWDALNQIGRNKLSPYGRAAWVLATSQKVYGQELTTTGGVLAEAGRQFFPIPITFAAAGGYVGHKLAPTVFPPLRAGAIQRQLTASAGIKVEPALTAIQRIRRMANDYMDREGLRKETGFLLQPTDEPGYYKLRSALVNNDRKEALRNLRGLLKTRTLTDVYNAMKVWIDLPVTGSRSTEAAFISSLSDQDIDLYNQALTTRYQIMDKFRDLIISTPESELR